MSRKKRTKIGLRGESNSGPLAPEARIIPLDHKAAGLGAGSVLIHNGIQGEEQASIFNYQMGFIPVALALSLWLITLIVEWKRILLFGKWLLRFSFHVGQLLVSVLHFGFFALSVLLGYELIAFYVHFKRSRRKRGWRMDYNIQMEDRLNGDDNDLPQVKELRAEITKEWLSSESIQNEISRNTIGS